MVSDARLAGIAPPTIPLGLHAQVVSPLAIRPSGGDFYKSEKRGRAALGGAAHVCDGVVHAVFVGECANGAADGLRVEMPFAAIAGAEELRKSPRTQLAMEGIHA